MLGAFAQAESESISANVRWGKRQAMREGKTIIQYKRLYAYEKGEDGKPKIIPEQADGAGHIKAGQREARVNKPVYLFGLLQNKADFSGKEKL